MLNSAYFLSTFFLFIIDSFNSFVYLSLRENIKQSMDNARARVV